MKTGIRIVIALCVAAGFGAAGLFGTETLLEARSAAQDSGRDSGPRAVRVGVATPERRTLERRIDGVGTVMAERTVALRPSVPGRVTEVAVASGAEVSEGDLILQLDDRAQRARLAGARASLEEARKDLRRIEELADSNTAAEQRLEAARATFARAEAEEMAARAALDDRRVVAPFDGTLGLIDVDAGAYVAPQDVIAPLSDLSTVQVDMSVPERHFARISTGQAVELRVPAYPDRRFDGNVIAREARVDAAARSFDLRARVENPQRDLVGGMFARTGLIVAREEGLAIPDDAIIAEGETTYVYTVVDGTARRTEVTPGQSLGELTEVTGALDADSRVVVSGWNRLRDGAPVTVAEDIAREGLQ